MSETLAMWLLVLGAGCLAAWRFTRILWPLKSAASALRTDHPGERLRGMIKDVFLHKRLLKFRYSGVLHAMIFSGFLVLLTAIIQSIGSRLFPGFSLNAIGGRTWIAIVQEVFAVVILVGIGMAAWQRFIRKPARFAGSNKNDAGLIYLLVLCVVSSMLGEFATAVLSGHSPATWWRPISGAIAGGLATLGMSPATAARVEPFFFWMHVISILCFLVYIPGSKHRHMFTAIPNIYFRDLEPKGLMRAPPPERGQVGVSKVEQFTWKDMLDVYSCTECGRCQSVCPAHAAGQPLSPKLLIMDIRDHLMDAAAGKKIEPLVGGTIKDSTLWACTTCRACM
jgi:nitrate reductase gamma subunit/ferredoxin